MEAIQGLIITGVVLILYFAPTWATKRGRRGSVFVLNLFLGWTLIGWVVAFFLAVRSHEGGKAVL